MFNNNLTTHYFVYRLLSVMYFLIIARSHLLIYNSASKLKHVARYDRILNVVVSDDSKVYKAPSGVSLFIYIFSYSLFGFLRIFLISVIITKT